jgi:hypothetical protein
LIAPIDGAIGLDQSTANEPNRIVFVGAGILLLSR